MKKIALLFTIVCAGQLYGMEPMEAERIGDLPEELQREITQAAITSSNTLDEAIAMIKKLSASFGVQYDTLFANINDKLFTKNKDFTQLVHMLSNKFNLSTEEIAKKFETPAAKNYLQLANMLMDSVTGEDTDVKGITTLIEKYGADVNYTFATAFPDTGATILTWAIAHGNNPETIKLLLNLGANPNLKNQFGMTALEWAQEFTGSDEELKQLIKETMNK